ncbi:eCIS core domain-containing protein [Actinokineospora diospyrosa]|uniref:eCIS core domain-containing protein n=1 Tax=Actinokineospora diospyrosa TaxID=103728 RepID=A0ABT1IBW2_9PSEU|nr:DUF4157 domain-containing protein [Actinokineospora diospyrosa]MCP2270120.1 protein of unknown function (DUF4157) [Actinokineospora diospyrosa]
MHDHGHDHEHDRPERQSAPRRTAQPDEAGPGTRTVHQLQRSMGNAAVARLLQGAEEETAEPTTVPEVLSGSGRPLDAGKRTDMESRLGADFSTVRVHNDTAAARSADEIGARAYTSGEHVVLGRGGAEDHTLAHELWHVVQQREGPVSATDNGTGVALSDPGDRFERAAEQAATQAMSNAATQAHDRSGHDRTEHDHTGHDHSGPGHVSGEAAVQRSPRDWRHSDSVRDALTAEPGMGLRSYWPPIVQAVRLYISILDDTQVDQRAQVLDRLDGALDSWEGNQGAATTINITGQARNKRAIVNALRALITTERSEIRTLRQGPPAAAAPTPAAPIPMAVPMAIGGASRQRPGEESEDSSPETGVPLSTLRDRFQSAGALPTGIDIHLHMTSGRNLPGIHAQGLQPGAGQGIGLPDTERQGDNNFIYLLSSSPDAKTYVGQESGGRGVGVISSGVAFGPDTNYDGGAYQHHGSAPPARGAAQGDGPFSFTLPATPRTRAGLRDFVNGHLDNGQQPMSENEAVQRVLAALWNEFGLLVARDLSRT